MSVLITNIFDDDSIKNERANMERLKNFLSNFSN